MEINPSFYEDDEDDEWEDQETLQTILTSVPEGWTLVRVMAGWANLIKMREWLQENTTGPYREVKWLSGCSYSVGVMLEEPTDIIMFKLRWG